MHHGLELLKIQGAIVEGRRQAKAILRQGLLVPPPNVGKNVTPLYNDADGKAVSGATTLGDLDVYTKSFKVYRLELPTEQQSELSGYELYLRRERADARQRATVSFANPRTTARRPADSGR